MKIVELRRELNETTKIFLSAKYYELDFKYIHTIKYTTPTVYKTFYLFIERIYHSVSVALILDISKLFDEREKFSFIKLRNKMLDNYEKSELCSYLPKDDIENLFSSVNNGNIDFVLKKMKDTRDKYYAHLDRTKPDFEKIQINSNETSMLISIAENLLKSLESKYFHTSINYDLNKSELGHNIFERLNEWEKYRAKYGYIKES